MVKPHLLKTQKLARCGQVPVIPASQEDEAGESLEPGRQRLQWAEISPLHFSLGKRSQRKEAAGRDEKHIGEEILQQHEKKGREDHDVAEDEAPVLAKVKRVCPRPLPTSPPLSLVFPAAAWYAVADSPGFWFLPFLRFGLPYARNLQ
ncbi:hypothetical protein AAY473_032737 [Plecturocebus cupreus]